MPASTSREGKKRSTRAQATRGENLRAEGARTLRPKGASSEPHTLAAPRRAWRQQGWEEGPCRRGLVPKDGSGAPNYGPNQTSNNTRERHPVLGSVIPLQTHPPSKDPLFSSFPPPISSCVYRILTVFPGSCLSRSRIISFCSFTHESPFTSGERLVHLSLVFS